MVLSVRMTVADDDFVEDHDDFVGRIAERVRTELDLSTPVEDLIGDGRRGLLEAQSRFDESRGVRFRTFAYYRVRGAILDGVRRMGFTGKRAAGRRRRAVEADRILQDEGAANPAAGDGSAGDREATALVDEVCGKLTSGFLLDGVGEFERAPADSPEAATITKLDSVRALEAMDALPRRERLAVQWVFLEGRPLDDVAAELKLTRSGASRLSTRALGLLRAALE